MKNLYFLPLLVLAISCGGSKAKMEMPPMELACARASEAWIENTSTFTSKIEPLRSYTLQPRVAGFLESENCSDGQMVKKGQTLYTIDPSSYRLATKESLASLARARASLKNAQSNYKRIEPLSKIKAVSQSSLDSALATLRSAKEDVEVAQAALNIAKLNQGYTKIMAPDRGIISKNQVQVGDYVGIESEYPILATLNFIDTIQLALSLPMTTYLQDVGTTPEDSIIYNIELTMSDGSKYPQQGWYGYTEAEVGTTSGSILLVVYFENRDHHLKSGQFAKINSSIGRPRRGLVIPQKALIEEQGTNFVYLVAPDSTLSLRAIEVGKESGEMIEVVKGLTDNDAILCEGFYKVGPKSKISPQFTTRKR